MKKILALGLFLAVNANAGSWTYEYLKSDFGDDTKVASIKDDNDKFELAVTSNNQAGSDKNIIALFLPKGFVTSSDCKSICTVKINVDGNKEIEPIKLLESSSFRTYFVYGESRKRVLDYFKNSQVVKIQLPLYRDITVVTFTPKNALDLDKLDNLKP